MRKWLSKKKQKNDKLRMMHDERQKCLRLTATCSSKSYCKKAARLLRFSCNTPNDMLKGFLEKSTLIWPTTTTIGLSEVEVYQTWLEAISTESPNEAKKIPYLSELTNHKWMFLRFWIRTGPYIYIAGRSLPALSCKSSIWGRKCGIYRKGRCGRMRRRITVLHLNL